MNSIKRLIIGSLFAGFIISNNIPPTIPQITIPYYLKMIALEVTILGFILALEISNIIQNLKFNYPSNAFKFSNILGYFPTIIHRLTPYINLTISQKISILSPRLDLTRKYFTKNNLTYPNKNVDHNHKPKKLNQTVFSLLPSYNYYQYSSI